MRKLLFCCGDARARRPMRRVGVCGVSCGEKRALRPNRRVLFRRLGDTEIRVVGEGVGVRGSKGTTAAAAPGASSSGNRSPM